jgi:hypothetical protein
MRTRLKRHIHGRPSRILPPPRTIGKRRPLSMQLPKFRMEALANNAAITHDNRANEGIRTNSPAPVLSQL